MKNYHDVIGLRNVTAVSMECEMHVDEYSSYLDRKWQFRKTSSHAFRDTDDPTTKYTHSGKPCCMLSVTLTIQRPYMAGLGYYKKLLCYTRTCKVSSLFLIVYYTHKMTIQRKLWLVWGLLRLAPTILYVCDRFSENIGLNMRT